MIIAVFGPRNFGLVISSNGGRMMQETQPIGEARPVAPSEGIWQFGAEFSKKGEIDKRSFRVKR